MAAYDQAVGIMRNMPNIATAIIQKAQENGIKAGMPFEYTRTTPPLDGMPADPHPTRRYRSWHSRTI